MAIAFLGIGANLGDREENIRKAMELLGQHEDIEVLTLSDRIETKPVGGPKQEKFLNAAAKIKTDLLPLELLSQLKIVERRLGRAKAAELNGPRPIDLDILFYDDVVITKGKTLAIPHPRLAERRFVLEPLSQIAPELVHPRLNKTVIELREALKQASH